jgi:NAD+ kinase
VTLPAQRVAVITHRRPDQVVDALAALRQAATAAGVVLCFDPAEAAKLGLQAEPGIEVDTPAGSAALVDLCVVLGGDGTILSALGRFAGHDVPVFAVNFGEVGFLATIEPDGDLVAAFSDALAGRFDILDLPALQASGPGLSATALNDVALHRRPGLRVADLSYGIGPDEVGRVRCDGLVVATPAGSTGYNLANGGPVMAWGVEGYVVSFIAPHSLTARTLVVAPGDVLKIANQSEERVDVTIDGRPAGELAPGEVIETRFQDSCARLAQAPGASFYHRLREKFGRMAS